MLAVIKIPPNWSMCLCTMMTDSQHALLFIRKEESHVLIPQMVLTVTVAAVGGGEVGGAVYV